MVCVREYLDSIGHGDRIALSTLATCTNKQFCQACGLERESFEEFRRAREPELKLLADINRWLSVANESSTFAGDDGGGL